jgi:plastocyanin
MRKLAILPILTIIAALSGCASDTPTTATNDQPAAQTAQATALASAALAPTTTATPVPASTRADQHALHGDDYGAYPTSVAATAAGSDTDAAQGALSWRDGALRSDAVQLTVTGLAAPQPGQSYIAQLGGDAGALPLGALAFDGSTATLSYSAPDAANLLGAYQQITIARSDTPTVILSGTLPAEALRHIRALLASAPGTPNAVGFAVGLRQEADTLLQHAQFLRESYAAGDLALVRRHAEHIVNIVRGADATDGNGDGVLENPGDGWGLLPNSGSAGYIGDVTDSATLAAAARDSTENIKVHAEHVAISGDNVRGRVEQIEQLATQILAAQELAATRPDVLALLALAEQTVQGTDADGDEQITPTPGEGGVLTAYQHAQLIAQLPLTPNDALAAAPVATVATAAPPTAVSVATQAATQQVASAAQNTVVAMSDFAFTAQELRIKAGTTVVWRNEGVKAHSATAVDGSFDTGLLPFGGAQSVTFDAPGTYRYFCEIHGTPDGTDGMVGTVIVE